jgi:hypothetical protein
MIVEGRQNEEKQIDYNAHFEATLRGELKEDVARRTLGKFLMYNIGILVRFLTGFILYPDQRLMIKGWLFKNNSLTIMSRGGSKSFTFSHFCYLYCLFNPGKTVIMIAPNFRSSRKIVENIEKWASSKRGALLRACIKPGTTGMLASKKPDVWSIEFKNGARVIALPLGPDGESLRGYRCSVLGVDEGLRIPTQIIDTVLKPFLVAIPEEETLRRQEIDERERRLIAAGKMKPEEKTKWKSDAKMIILSSASYAWEDLFTTYKNYLKKIYAGDEEMIKKLDSLEKKKLNEDEEAKAEVVKGADIPSSYLVQQFSYEALPPERIDSSIREEIESGMYSQSTIDREYKARFVQDSDGYYSAKIMELCTLHGASEPCAEIVGEKGAEYILAIDPNMAQSENADHFAMCVIKIITKQTEGHAPRKVGLVVHQYANAGAKLEHHIAYLFYLLRFFNIVYLACDTSQGDNADFINICNESEMFKSNKLVLNAIEADFGKETFDHLVEEIQRSYNKAENRIVQKQYFHSAFQRAANEHLQASFNRRSLLFPAKILDNPAALDRLLEQGVGSIIDTHPDFTDEVGKPGNKHDFIEQQDTLVDLVKKECALIQVNVSSLGNLSYDLPQHIKRSNKNKGRVRRDSFSALFLGNWALKLYLEAQERPMEQYDSYFASWAGTNPR